MIGQGLSLAMAAIEEAIIEFEALHGNKPGYTGAGVRAALKIFMSVLMDRLWEKQDKDGKTLPERLIEAEKMGNELRDLLLKYTGIDSRKLY